MKIYYYEFSDDGINWNRGLLSWSVMNCIDMAQRQPYSWRIMESEITKVPKLVSDEKIEKSKEILKILNQIFQ
jgi:hypothetical protein